MVIVVKGEDGNRKGETDFARWDHGRSEKEIKEKKKGRKGEIEVEEKEAES